MSDLPEYAPRGKQFAVQRQSHVVDSPEHPVVLITGTARYDFRGHAEKARAEFDWRLNATVIIVDKEKP